MSVVKSNVACVIVTASYVSLVTCQSLAKCSCQSQLSSTSLAAGALAGVVSHSCCKLRCHSMLYFDHVSPMCPSRRLPPCCACQPSGLPNARRAIGVGVGVGVHIDLRFCRVWVPCLCWMVCLEISHARPSSRGVTPHFHMTDPSLNDVVFKLYRSMPSKSCMSASCGRQA